MLADPELPSKTDCTPNEGTVVSASQPSAASEDGWVQVAENLFPCLCVCVCVCVRSPVHMLVCTHLCVCVRVRACEITFKGIILLRWMWILFWLQQHFTAGQQSRMSGIV
jgi:hypothetical protein